MSYADTVKVATIEQRDKLLIALLAAESRLDDATRLLKRWASQRLPDEVTPEAQEDADYEFPYEAMVREARAFVRGGA